MAPIKEVISNKFIGWIVVAACGALGAFLVQHFRDVHHHGELLETQGEVLTAVAGQLVNQSDAVQILGRRVDVIYRKETTVVGRVKYQPLSAGATVQINGRGDARYLIDLWRNGQIAQVAITELESSQEYSTTAEIVGTFADPDPEYLLNISSEVTLKLALPPGPGPYKAQVEPVEAQ